MINTFFFLNDGYQKSKGNELIQRGVDIYFHTAKTNDFGMEWFLINIYIGEHKLATALINFTQNFDMNIFSLGGRYYSFCWS